MVAAYLSCSVDLMALHITRLERDLTALSAVTVDICLTDDRGGFSTSIVPTVTIILFGFTATILLEIYCALFK